MGRVYLSYPAPGHEAFLLAKAGSITSSGSLKSSKAAVATARTQISNDVREEIEVRVLSIFYCASLSKFLRQEAFGLLFPITLGTGR